MMGVKTRLPDSDAPPMPTTPGAASIAVALLGGMLFRPTDRISVDVPRVEIGVPGGEHRERRTPGLVSPIGGRCALTATDDCSVRVASDTVPRRNLVPHGNSPSVTKRRHEPARDEWRTSHWPFNY